MLVCGFPKARVTRDCFHVIKNCGGAIDEIRLRLKREAVKRLRKLLTGFKQKLERLDKQRKAYKARMKRKYGKKWHKSNRVRLFHLDIDCHGTIIAFSPFYLFAQY